MIRVCPHSDSTCPNGMACTFSCATSAYDGTKRAPQTSSSDNGEGDVEGLVERLTVELRSAAPYLGDPGLRRLHAVASEAASAISKLKGERDELDRKWFEDRTAWAAQWSRDQKEIGELREGLRPFAEAARMLRFDPPQFLWEYEPERLEYAYDHDGKGVFTYGALEAEAFTKARALLSRGRSGEGNQGVSSSQGSSDARSSTRPDSPSAAGGEP